MDDIITESEVGLESFAGEMREFLYGVDLVYISLLSSVFFVTLIIFDLAYNFAFPGRFDQQRRRRRQWRQQGGDQLGYGSTSWVGRVPADQSTGASGYPFTEAYWRDRSNDVADAVNNSLDGGEKKYET